MGFTTEQEDELWIRWRRGESSRLIGRALRCHPPLRASVPRTKRRRAPDIAAQKRPSSDGDRAGGSLPWHCRGLVSARDRGVDRPFGVDGFARDRP